jgi:D-serine dehydratase
MASPLTDIVPHDKLNLDACLQSPIDWTLKSSPSAAPGGCTLADVPFQGWNLLREDLVFPCAVLKQSALRHNSLWMRRYLAATGALIAPHGKTSMAPQLFDMQLRDGAWAMTAATAAHVRIYRQFGVSRILMANQLIGRQNITVVLDELRRDPAFDFYCLVDSEDGIAILEEAIAAAPIGRRLQVLVEVGMEGGRTGARSVESALTVARRAAASPYLSLRGVECFEGIIRGGEELAADNAIKALTRTMTMVARAAVQENLFGSGPVILTAGGSAFFDIVARELTDSDIGRATQVVIRSGCYLTHDSGFYRDLVADLLRRDLSARALGDLRPSLEVWATVQSRPERDRVVISLGKRDAPYDVRLPTPLVWSRTGMAAPEALSDDHLIIRLDDQHGYMSIPPDGPLRVGDLIGLGVSHPCGAFDRWPVLFIVDDDYNVTSAVKTYF